MKRTVWILVGISVLGLSALGVYSGYERLHGNARFRQAFRMATTHRFAISDAEAAEDERKLQRDPDDVPMREDLISYYFDRAIQHQDASLQEKRSRHVLWLIAHYPEDDFLASPFAVFGGDEPHFAEMKALWLKAAANNDVDILRNASEALFSEPKTSREMANRGLKKDPNDPILRKLVAQSFTHELKLRQTPEARTATAADALTAWQAYLSVEKDEDEKFRHYVDIANAALESNHLVEAQRYAHDLLAHDDEVQRKASENGDSIHSQPNADDIHGANTVLGRVALRNGDIEEAKRRLLASANQNGSPVLGSFGPRMTLASELLDHGQKDVVLEYLQACSKFWQDGEDDLTKWQSAIRAGKKPDFGPNMF